MPENRGYLPEGLSAPPLYTLEMLRRAVSDGTVLEGTVQRCDGDLNLYLQLGSTFAKIPREEVTAPWISGADREIAVLSRVGKQVCFTVESLSADAKGAPTALLSRRKVQEQAMEEMCRGLTPGAVVMGRVVRTEPFGAFVDIGRGIVALLPTEYISAARIRHPNERFRVGQKILAAVKVFDRENRRITLTHKELLGTWLENASRFSEGDVIAFYHGNKLLIKRYIAGPSDWVNIDQNGNVSVNGMPLDEPYLVEKAYGETNIELPYQVPDERYFVMGDNRDVSIDSRSTTVGCIAKDQIVGKVVFRIWPLSDFGPVR